jgi:predicted transcriptional regulator
VLGTTVGELMQKNSHSCDVTLALPKAASLLHNKGTQRLFVLNNQKHPIGVLTRGDVVRAIASHQTN